MTFSEETGDIRLAHFSVKEFLTSEKEEKGVFTPQLKVFTAHESIIEIIVAYLLSLTNTRLRLKAIEETYHLATYCSNYWMDHAKLVEENSASVRQRLLEFFSNKKAWFICNRMFELEKLWWIESLDEVPAPLYIASLTGLKYLVEDLLRQGADIDADTGEYGTALRVACVKGHLEIARVLIDSGANLDVVCGLKPGTALVTAIDHDINIACLLIDRGADPSTRGGTREGFYGEEWREIYPLHAACLRDSEEVVKALIDKKVDIDLKDEYYGTPLESASGDGNEKVVKLLLEQGANVDAPGYEGTTALHEAVRGPHEHIVQLLLKHGADANLRDNDGSTPLHLAATIGAPDGVIQLLLDHGADIHLRDDVEDLTPLEKAELQDHKDAAQLLRAAKLAAPPSPSRTEEDTDEIWSEETEDSMSEND
ncbi:Ankyrin repeat protein [Lasiodiplodia theobromae]|uniref:Ankyrin repeat protein n=1 Tax=Lasiodiplodia theobromae TaxID=45133 RepID=A0A8H7IQN3_9PEZI|nr:Ankyrin repeat protein [Lasiodiplodia theobromae]